MAQYMVEPNVVQPDGASRMWFLELCWVRHGTLYDGGYVSQPDKRAFSSKYPYAYVGYVRAI
jgi:hypothetical protein